MYTPLHLFYLNQLDIYPWIEKAALIDCFQKKLIMVSSSPLTPVESSFLNQIARYIGIPSDDLAILDTGASGLQNISNQLSEKVVICLFGFKEIPVELQSSPHFIISTHNLAQLMIDHQLKKKLFFQLSTAKSYLVNPSDG